MVYTDLLEGDVVGRGGKNSPLLLREGPKDEERRKSISLYAKPRHPFSTETCFCASAERGGLGELDDEGKVSITEPR